jgi:S-layer homology domain
MRRLISAFGVTLMLCGVSAMAQVQPRDPIMRVVDAGLMQVYPNGDFRPDQVLTRAEVANIVVRTFDLAGRAPSGSAPTTPVDVPAGYWAYDDIQIVLRTGVMAGYQAGRFYPEQRVTRAEAFSIVAQAYGVAQFPQQSIDRELAAYSDADEIPSWARKPMATALSIGLVNTGIDGQIRPLEPMTRADMAFALSAYLDQSDDPYSPL